MTDKTPEALEVVQQLDRIFKTEVQDYDVILDAASVIRRQHQRIEELERALRGAATSLETISRLAGHSHYVGDGEERIPTYMGEHDQVRMYASTRAAVARTLLSTTQPDS